MSHWLIAALREPVVALAQLFVAAAALAVAQRARSSAVRLNGRVDDVERAVEPTPSASSSTSQPTLPL